MVGNFIWHHPSVSPSTAFQYVQLPEQEVVSRCKARYGKQTGQKWRCSLGVCSLEAIVLRLNSNRTRKCHLAGAKCVAQSRLDYHQSHAERPHQGLKKWNSFQNRWNRSESIFTIVISFGYQLVFKMEPDPVLQNPQKPAVFHRFCNPRNSLHLKC
jgi:hypothetical protein